MQRIQDPTAVTNQPAPPVLTGQPIGFFQGSIAGGIVTRIRYWWLNMIQEELVGLLTSAGLLPDGTKTISQAVAIIGKRVFVQDAAGNYAFVVPAGVFEVLIRFWGPGGGGGGASVALSCAVGGGGGGAVELLLPVTPGDNLAIVMAAPGAGGSAAGSNGIAGGLSTLSRNGAVLCAVNGGNGGAGSTGGVANIGAQGGMGVDNTGLAYIVLGGQSGSPGLISSPNYYGGQGGASPNGGGVAGRTSNTGTTSDSGIYPGGGGNGGGGDGAGGNGAIGRLEIRY